MKITNLSMGEAGFANAKILILKQITIGYKNQLNGQS